MLKKDQNINKQTFELRDLDEAIVDSLKKHDDAYEAQMIANFNAKVNSSATDKQKEEQVIHAEKQEEVGGQKGPEPTRFGDWEKKGRCSDF